MDLPTALQAFQPLALECCHMCEDASSTNVGLDSGRAPEGLQLFKRFNRWLSSLGYTRVVVAESIFVTDVAARCVFRRLRRLFVPCYLFK